VKQLPSTASFHMRRSYLRSSARSSYAIQRKKSSTFQLIFVRFSFDCSPITNGTRSFIRDRSFFKSLIISISSLSLADDVPSVRSTLYMSIS
ncbi:hypothetical protein PFISCL1PPCAC_11656, partial [Pristionchus fissidentatus]